MEPTSQPDQRPPAPPAGERAPRAEAVRRRGESPEGPHRVVVVGGGFAGLNAARGLGDPRLEVTLVDRRNFHLFQPLLYQVATGGLSPAEICAPLRKVLRRQRNTRVVLGEVVDVDPGRRRALLADGELPYDTLIVAAGSGHNYFGHSEWEERAPGLKTIEDATTIRSRILRAFEEAERTEDPRQRRRLLTFVIVGAGPTGVELAGAIAELARHILRREFRRIDPATARILLVDALDRVLPPYPEKLSAAAHRDLERLGVEIHTGARVEAVSRDTVTFRSGEQEWREEVGAILWTAGVKAPALAARLAAATGAETDRAGRLKVEPDLALPGHPEILVLGDMAALEGAGGDPLPGVAPVAIQQGKYAARLVRKRLDGETLGPFRYRDRGTVAVIGRAAAVADLPFARLSGAVAWLLWLFVHIMYLVGFGNRVLVLVEWAQSYVARKPGARLITDSREGPGGESRSEVAGRG